MKTIRIIPLLIQLITSCASKKDSEKHKPDVILIMTDDQGYGDLASHGNPWITPRNG